MLGNRKMAEFDFEMANYILSKPEEAVRGDERATFSSNWEGAEVRKHPPHEAEVKSMKRGEIKLSDVRGINDAIKHSINKEIIYPYKFPEQAGKFGKSFGGGVLLYGPPGCGKTYLAYAIAGELEIPLIDAGISSMRGKYHGDTVAMISNIFKKAKTMAPCIVLIDEIDAVGGCRENVGASLYLTEYIDQLLQEINNIAGTKVLLIGATNLPWAVDPAIRRSGRFDTHILIGAPDKKACKEILEYYIRKSLKGLGENVDCDAVAEGLEGFSASDVKAICGDVAKNLMEEYIEKKTQRKAQTKDFLDLINTRHSSLIPWYRAAAREIISSGEMDVFRDLVDEIERSTRMKGFDSASKTIYR